MSDMTYNVMASVAEKPLVWQSGEIKTPPFSWEARVEAGFLLRRFQQGEPLTMPQARAMPEIGARCYELRINDGRHNWRIMYRVDTDAIVIVEVFDKKTRQTPKRIIDNCKRRLRQYDKDG